MQSQPIPSTILAVIDKVHLQHLLEPFGLKLTPTQTGQTIAYLDLLFRWNAKINLTAIRTIDECVTRHFGESLFICRHLQLHGNLLDIGSGAGFPGLALKIAFPEVAVTLLEPVAKKRAFLKEAARVCGFAQVSVRADRLEDLAAASNQTFDFATMRAVGNLKILVPAAATVLASEGQLLLWLTREQTAELTAAHSSLTWDVPLPIPMSRAGEVWRGVKSP